MKIAITGGIACGKSLAGKTFEENGIPVRDTDDIAHELMQPGDPVFDNVVKAFGAGILDDEHSIDRSVLGKLVFRDPEKLEQLNELVHPQVMRVTAEWLQAQEQDSQRVAAVMIPLLYERGMQSGWDAVLCVAAPHADQLRRLCARGLSREDAEIRIRAQLDVRQKMKLADVVVFNSGSKELLGDQTRRAIRQILENSDG
ncbi:MAG: dephospho-CoA kinase [Verrucomicrobia bacterium]|nr:dephospho-CoA kinase [Verrucomicrobiota bacterium]